MPKRKKKARVKKEEKEEVFYVGMKDPIEVRRSILESSKEMVQYLQRAERFKKVRAKKAEQLARLRAIMKDISLLARKLKSALPKTKLRARPKQIKKQKFFMQILLILILSMI